MCASLFSMTIRRLCAAGALAAGLALAGAVHAENMTVLVGNELAAHGEFVRELRDRQAPGSRFDLVRIQPGVPDAAVPGTSPEDEREIAGVRTRSARMTVERPLVLAVGPVAARAAVERPGTETLLLAMLSRLDYESLQSHQALRRTDRRVGVLLRDPAMADQLAVVDAVLPQKRRLGVIATSESEALVRELQKAAQGWTLEIEYAPDARSLASALRTLVSRSDALMVLPDLIGDSQAATLSVLRAGASAGLPVFGASEGLVRSGGLAAAVSTPAQLAQQAQLLARKLASGGAGNGVVVEAATPATVRVNATVARGLGLRLPDERQLTERITAVR